MKIAYIVSLPHSGSTILSYNLSEHPDIVYLGEVCYALRLLSSSRNEATLRNCSCGYPISQCFFWRSVLKRLPEHFDEFYGYNIVIEEFMNNYGESKLLLDSNKTIDPLYFLRKKPGLEIFGIHTVRDFRGAVVSEAKRKKSKHPNRPEWITALHTGFQWMRRNHAINRSFFDVGMVGSCVTSYEKLCESPSKEIEYIWRFLGMAACNFQGSAPLQNAHSFFGNSLQSSGGLRTFSYDSRWKSSWIWWPCVLLMPMLLLLNRRWVYSR